jgi:LAS superfamily LD-carboxypeptidase LdcB
MRDTPAYRWLVAHAERFGFYPYDLEPWHWEYNPPHEVSAGARE